MKIAKILLITTLIFCFQGWSSADEANMKNEAWVIAQAFNKASQFARSISCETYTKQSLLVTLVPLQKKGDVEDRINAKYALIWFGDIGCGSGTAWHGPHISIIRIGAGDSFFVDPRASSPMVKFRGPPIINKIIAVKENELTLSGVDWGPDDPHCCPSVPVRIRLRQDEKGNWNRIEEN